MQIPGTYSPPLETDLATHDAYARYLASQDPSVKIALETEYPVLLVPPSREDIDSVITPDFLRRHYLELVATEKPIDVGYGGSGLYSTRYAPYLGLIEIPAAAEPEICYQSDAAERAARQTRAQAAPNLSAPEPGSPEAALAKLQSLFAGEDGYYPKTLAVIERQLATATIPGASASVPNFSIDLFTAFLQGWLKDPLTAAVNVSETLAFLGVPADQRQALARSLSSFFYRTLSETFGCAPGERLQDNLQFLGFQMTLSRNAGGFSSLATRTGNPASLLAPVRDAAHRLVAESATLAAALSATGSTYYGTLMDFASPTGSISEPLAAVRSALEEQKENVESSMKDISAMTEPGDIAGLVKTFEGDARDVAWIYERIGIPKNPETGAYLVDEIYDQMDMRWDWRRARPEWGFERTDIRKPAGTDWMTWSLAFQIAREKKKIDLGETAFQVFAIGGSIAATIGGTVVAGPAGGIAAGTFVAAATGAADVYRASVRLEAVDAANAAHHMADLPIGSDEHLEIVDEAKNYAVDAAVAGVFLALGGGVASPALSGAAKTLVPGSKLGRLALSTVFQGLYGAADGGTQALSDRRQTGQDYLDRSTALARPGEEAPSWVEGLVFSATVGAVFGAGAEAGFGSVDVIFRFGSPAPQIVESRSGRILGDFRLSPDGTHLIGPDGRSHPIAQRGNPRLLVKENGDAVSGDSTTPRSGDETDVETDPVRKRDAGVGDDATVPRREEAGPIRDGEPPRENGVDETPAAAESKPAANKDDFKASMRAYLEKNATLSSADFHRLFDGILSQANVGNCYLISAFNALRTNPELFETLMRTSIKALPDGSFQVRLPLGATIAQVVTISPAEITEQWNKGFLRKRADGRRDWRPILWAPGGGDGFKILEAAFIKQQYGRVDRRLSEGGSGNDALHRLMGNLVGKKTLGDADRPLRDNGADEALRFLDDFDPDRDLATVSTRLTDSGDDTETVVVNGRTFALNHSYSIKEVDKAARTVTVLNPWNDNEPITLSYDEFLEAFTEIESVEIDYNRLFGRLRFD